MWPSNGVTATTLIALRVGPAHVFVCVEDLSHRRAAPCPIACNFSNYVVVLASTCEQLSQWDRPPRLGESIRAPDWHSFFLFFVLSRRDRWLEVCFSFDSSCRIILSFGKRLSKRCHSLLAATLKLTCSRSSRCYSPRDRERLRICTWKIN